MNPPEQQWTQPPPQEFGWLDRWSRGALIKRLDRQRHGRIVLRDAIGPSIRGPSHDLCVKMDIHQPRFYRDIALGGTLGAAESYVQGVWDCDDLTSLFRIFLRNRETLGKVDGWWAGLRRWQHRMYHRWRSNTKAGSRRNIAAHYDLGNDFFQLWLDKSMAYSSAIFQSPNSSLQQASIEKFDRICRKLALQPDDDVLEIGGGWGGFAIHAAREYGAHITSTTISKQQFEFAAERIQESGLNGNVKLLSRDYRDLRGKFDKLVSIEMVEAVGYRQLDSFFRTCSELLKPDGSMVLQAIVMPDRQYSSYLKSVDFIQRFVFPGGCLPSIGAINDAVARATDLRWAHIEDLAPHYAETLRRWRQSFEDNLNQIRQLGYTEQFIRMWRYYLCYCEAAFEERYLGIVQIQLAKPMCKSDPVEITRRAAAKDLQAVNVRSRVRRSSFIWSGRS